MIKWSGCFAWRNNRALPIDLALATGVRQGSDQLNEMLHKLRAESPRPLKDGLKNPFARVLSGH